MMYSINIEDVLEKVTLCSKSYLPSESAENYATFKIKSNLKISHTKGVVDIFREMAKSVYHLKKVY